MNDLKFSILGDPHLGRRFITGVPPHRRGDREKMVWRDFQQHLTDLPSGTSWHICVGDLFDQFHVPAAVTLRAFEIYQRAAFDQPGVTFFVMRGNHDVSRNTALRSSFDLFTALVAHVPNIKVLNEPRELEQIAFIPYDPFTPVIDAVRDISPGIKTAIMHHDYVDFGGQDVIPTAQLAEQGVELVINGHDHVKRTEVRHGVTVQMTGSMQPYTHSEDPERNQYLTMTLEEFTESDLDFTDLNLRLILREGEEAPTDLDCLSLITQRQLDQVELDEVDISGFETFDLPTAIAQVVDPTLKDELLEMFHAD